MFDYGKKIKQIRNKNDISAYKLAKDLKVSQPTISRIETGSGIPSLQLLEKICEYFSISMSDFFYDDNSIEEPQIFESNTYSDLPLEDIIYLYIQLYPENSTLVLNQTKSLKKQQEIISTYQQNLKKTQDTLKEQKENYEMQQDLFRNMLINHIRNKKDLD